MDGGVAQGLEQAAHNRLVVGSSPTAPTMFMIYSSFYRSPLGEIVLQSDGEFLTGLRFLDSSKLPLEGNESMNLEIFQTTSRWLDSYFIGQDPGSLPKYHIESASNFQKEVLEIVSKVPYGTTISYGEIAKQLSILENKQMSARAIGGALARNPIWLVIPCHRVIGANGRLGGYAGEAWRKLELLKLESMSINKHDLTPF